MTTNVRLILDELGTVFSGREDPGEESLINGIVNANKIVCVGAGRVGLAVAGFAKRLRHLGKDAFWIDDVTLPRTGEGDLMFVGSGSGETETIVTLASIAKRNQLQIGLVTCNPNSRLLSLSDFAVRLDCPSGGNTERPTVSAQPMTSLFEQACQIYLDAIVLDLMEKLNASTEDMIGRHNAIE